MPQSQIYDVLISDHRNVEDLFNQIESALDSGLYINAEELFEQLKISLTAHAKAEEEVFYEPLKIITRREDGGSDLIWEGTEEHHVASLILNELSRLDVEEPSWKSKLSVLCDLIASHVHEEENRIFNEARKYFSKEESHEMAHNFFELKEEYKTMVDEALAEDIELLLNPIPTSDLNKINTLNF